MNTWDYHNCLYLQDAKITVEKFEDWNSGEQWSPHIEKFALVWLTETAEFKNKKPQKAKKIPKIPKSIRKKTTYILYISIDNAGESYQYSCFILKSLKRLHGDQLIILTIN